MYNACMVLRLHSPNLTYFSAGKLQTCFDDSQNSTQLILSPQLTSVALDLCDADSEASSSWPVTASDKHTLHVFRITN